LAVCCKVVVSFLFEPCTENVHCVDLRFRDALDVHIDCETYVAVP